MGELEMLPASSLMHCGKVVVKVTQPSVSLSILLFVCLIGLQLPKAGHSILSWPGMQPVIVYKDGSLALLDSPSDVLGQSVAQDSHTLLWCHGELTKHGPCVVLVVRSEVSGHVICWRKCEFHGLASDGSLLMLLFFCCSSPAFRCSLTHSV